MRTALAGLMLAIAGGCAILELGESPLVPGSQWRVTALDGEPTAMEFILTFIGESATLSSECGASLGDVVMDTDGRAVSFGRFEGPSGPVMCSDEAIEEHRRAAEALEGVERWDSAGNDTELSGEGGVIRLQPQATDT